MHTSRPVEILVRKLEAGLTLCINCAHVGVHSFLFDIVFIFCHLQMAC
jgi:hypothetical protein